MLRLGKELQKNYQKSRGWEEELIAADAPNVIKHGGTEKAARGQGHAFASPCSHEQVTWQEIKVGWTLCSLQTILTSTVGLHTQQALQRHGKTSWKCFPGRCCCRGEDFSCVSPPRQGISEQTGLRDSAQQRSGELPVPPTLSDTSNNQHWANLGNLQGSPTSLGKHLSHLYVVLYGENSVSLLGTDILLAAPSDCVTTRPSMDTGE